MGFGKDGKGVIMREFRAQALGALANNSAILLGTKLSTLERFRMIKNEVYCTVDGLTTGEGTGLLFGLADGAFDVTEVEAALENNGPLGPNESDDAEVSERFVMLTGALDRETGTTAIFENEQGGHKMSNTIRWTFARTKSWNYFIYNEGPTITTGATARILGKSYGVWVL